MTTLAITGAAGRMGQRLIALAKQDGGFDLVAAIERPDHPAQARDAGEAAGLGPIGLPITFDLKPTPQVLIDFTAPASMRHWLKTCRDRHIAWSSARRAFSPRTTPSSTRRPPTSPSSRPRT